MRAAYSANGIPSLRGRGLLRGAASTRIPSRACPNTPSAWSAGLPSLNTVALHCVTLRPWRCIAASTESGAGGSGAMKEAINERSAGCGSSIFFMLRLAKAATRPPKALGLETSSHQNQFRWSGYVGAYLKYLAGYCRSQRKPFRVRRLPLTRACNILNDYSLVNQLWL